MLELLVGCLLGLGLSLIVIEGGMFGAVAAILVAVWLTQKRHLRALAGALVAFGLSWLLLSAREFVECAPTQDFCGNSNLLPFVLAALAVFGAGIGCAAYELRSRQVDQN